MAGNYYAPFTLRISEELIATLKLVAAGHKRSVNKEIEFILEQYVKGVQTDQK